MVVFWDLRAAEMILPMLAFICIVYVLFFLLLKKGKLNNVMIPVQFCVSFLIIGELIEIVTNSHNPAELPLYFSTLVFLVNGIVCFSKKNSSLYSVSYFLSLILGFYITLVLLITPYTIIFTMHENFSDYRHCFVYLSHLIDVFVFLWLATIKKIKFTKYDLVCSVVIAFLYSTLIVILSIVLLGANGDGYDFATHINVWWWYVFYPAVICALSYVGGYIVQKIPSYYIPFNKKWKF